MACKAVCDSIPCKTMCAKCKCYIAGLETGRPQWHVCGEEYQEPNEIKE